jgi:phenylpyruvate tautomerase PptA (4-oxalocrotonate tautomerase family)
MKTDEEKVRILIYEVSRENWGNARILGTDMKWWFILITGCR